MKTTDLLRWTTASITVLVLAAGAPACGAVSATQCSTDDECVPILGVAADRAQCAAGICQVKLDTVGNDAGPGPACTTNDDCTTAAGGAASICREKTCLGLLDDYITQTTDNYRGKKDAIVVGVIVPLTDKTTHAESAFDKTYVDGVKLAVEDWSGNFGGGGLLVGSERRPVVAVICDSQYDATRVVECVDHMTRLKVPAIVFRSTDDTNAGAARAIAAHALVYCSDCDPKKVSVTQTDSRLWLGAPPLESQHALRTEWVKKLEAEIVKQSGRPAGPVKVVLLSSNDVDNAAAVKSSLWFNGENGDANEKESVPKLKWRNLDVPNTDWHALGAEIVAFKPDIIVTTQLGSFFEAQVVPEVEKRWNETTMGPLPRYVGSESEAFDQGLTQLIGGNDDLRKRITGVWSELSDAVISNEEDFFESAFLARFNYRAGGVSTGFEAFYALQFGMVAALSGAYTSELRGEDLREGMRRLVGGPPENAVDFKPSEIQRGVSLLQQQQVIDVRGLASDLEWDPVTGVPQSGAGTWCPARKGNSILTEEFWKYDYKTHKTVGAPDTLGVCGY